MTMTSVIEQSQKVLEGILKGKEGMRPMEFSVIQMI